VCDTVVTPQYHAAFGTVPYTLASVDQSPVYRPRTLPPSATRTPSVGFIEVNEPEEYMLSGSEMNATDSSLCRRAIDWFRLHVTTGVYCQRVRLLDEF
jgi:hypothetical protein